MFRARQFNPWLLSIALLSTACASAIHITYPKAGHNNNPVTRADLVFEPKFEAGQPWSITLDGVPLSGYVPTPVPGGTSTVPLVINYTSSGSHKLVASSTCSAILCGYSDEVVDFIPPSPRFNLPPGMVSPKLYVTTPVSLTVVYPPSVPIPVTVQETTTPISFVRMGLSPGALNVPGSPLLVTIPAGSAYANFYIEGQTATSFKLEMHATGTNPGFFGATIVP